MNGELFVSRFGINCVIINRRDYVIRRRETFRTVMSSIRKLTNIPQPAPYGG